MAVLRVCRGSAACEDGMVLRLRKYGVDTGTLVGSGSVSAAGAGAFDYYISPSGDNGDPGTQSEPWATMAYAITQMSGGESLGFLDGTYTENLPTIPANLTFEAVNDGAVIFTGTFEPGNAGFTVRGIRVESTNEKILGGGNLYNRMTFAGGPSSGNTVNSQVGAGTTVTESLFHGFGGRYLLLDYQQNGVTLQDIIFRYDGGWDDIAPHAVCTVYDSSGFSGLRLVTVNCLDSASPSSERLGGQGVNTHTAVGNAGSASHCIAVDSGGFGRFWHDGQGSHDFTWTDCESYGNGYEYGMTRTCGGTTTATRFDSDANTPVDYWAGTINRTSGSQLALNTDFLDDPRWLAEMKAMRTGSLGAVSSLVDYINSFRP